jgi:putative transposase
LKLSIATDLGQIQHIVDSWTRKRNPLERLLREIRRRTRVVETFPDRQSTLKLATARVRDVPGTALSINQYVSM